ncbi:MAG: putative DNA modification/repair radical SAM protein [Lachnospiraceae bacterium]|nr:putative DNA modification/repair radical SAM protein [Lachnospiraceae bacterium]
MAYVENLSIEEKLKILTDAAKYDVACTSSGVERKGKAGMMGNAAACGICHSFSADGRCVSLLKILYTNECIYDCKYCINRKSNDVVRTSFTPEEICDLTMQFYRHNYIEGLFLSSGIKDNPTKTMEEIYMALHLLRNVHRFNGYIHVKAIPGAEPQIIEQVGFLADRMSTNLELPTADGLRELAPNKTRKTILAPMRQIQNGIVDRKGGIHRIGCNKHNGDDWGLQLPNTRLSKADGWGLSTLQPENPSERRDYLLHSECDLLHTQSIQNLYQEKSKFVPAGQSTQMIIGATPENDYQILSVAEALYNRFDLKRVFYSAYVALNEDSKLPALNTKPPLLREHRLYQADWLLRFYGFEANELLSEDAPNFNMFLDPKCEWALRHLEYFPVEINTASYAMLLRIPGIGTKSARRIVMARKNALLDFDNLKRIGVVLKRAHYFITCKGKMMHQTKIDQDYITRQILQLENKKNWELEYSMTYRQLSLFDDHSFVEKNQDCLMIQKQLSEVV